MSKTWKRTLFGGLAAVIAFSGFVGFAHTGAGRPLLAWLSGAPGCPVSLEGGDASTVEEFRVAQLKRAVGSETARSHPALEFELGRTHRDAVSSWARAQGATCKSLRDESVLRCTGFAKRAGDALVIDDAHLQFDARGVLVAVDVYRRRSSADEALALVQQRAKALDAAVGPRTQDRTHAASLLRTQPFTRVAVSYEYRQYVAELSATNLAERGIRVRERYSYLPATSLALNDRVP
ncbi:MAG TPA: hypothetical protein VI072_09140 [Polyangiaceae bacterium]